MNPLVGYALAYAGGAALQKGLGFLLFLWLAQALSVADYARFGLLYALQSGLATLAGAGIAESVVGLLGSKSPPPQRRNLLDAANGVFVQLAILMTAIVALGYIIALRPSADGMIDLAFVLVGGLLTAFFALQAVLVRLDEQHAAALALGAAAPLAGLTAAFAAFIVQPGVGSFYLGMMGGLGAAVAVLRRLRVGHYGIVTRSPAATSIRGSLGPYLAIGLLTWLGGYGTTYLVEWFFNTTSVARFTFVYTLSSVMQLVATSTNQVWSPRVYRMATTVPVAEQERRNRLFYTLQGTLLGVVGAAMLFLLPPVVEAVGGNLLAYRGLIEELLLLLAGYAVSIPWWHTQNYYYVHGRGRALMQIVVITNLVGLALWLVLMAFAGVMGVYIGFFAQMLIRSIGAWFVARRAWQLHLAWQGPAIALLLMGLAALAANMLFPAT